MSRWPKRSSLGRFLDKIEIVTESGCWVWMGSSGKRYGQFHCPEMVPHLKMQKAHRASWFLHNGHIPEGLSVCHKCDNTFCVNPHHLFLGTHEDNMRDMINKGRYKHHTEYSEDTLIYIIKSDKSCKELSLMFNMDSGYISRLKRGLTTRSKTILGNLE